jgi:hypothetical protein
MHLTRCISWKSKKFKIYFDLRRGKPPRYKIIFLWWTGLLISVRRRKPSTYDQYSKYVESLPRLWPSALNSGLEPNITTFIDSIDTGPTRKNPLSLKGSSIAYSEPKNHAISTITFRLWRIYLFAVHQRYNIKKPGIICVDSYIVCDLLLSKIYFRQQFFLRRTASSVRGFSTISYHISRAINQVFNNPT